MKNDFYGIDISIKNEHELDSFLISNLSFSLKKGETLSIYCKEDEEKQALLSILSNENKKYTGFFNCDGNICNFDNKNCLKFFEFQDWSNFENFDQNKRIIELIEKNIFKSNNIDILEEIKINNKLDKHLKMLKIYKYKRIELAYLKAINIIITNAIINLKRIIEQQKKPKITQEELIKNYNIFIHNHIKYLRDRINILIDKNIMIVRVYLKKYNNKKIIERNHGLSNKVKKISKKIIELNFVDYQLNKMINQITSSFLDDLDNSELKNMNFVNENIEIINSLLFKFSETYKMYENQLKTLKVNSYEYKRILIKKNYYLKFWKLIKKESKNLIHLSQNQMLEFVQELLLSYKNILLKNEKILNLEDIKNIKKINAYLDGFINEQLSSIFEKYKKNSRDEKINKKRKTKQLRKTKNEEQIFNVENIKIELQDILDEIDWEKKSAFYDLNEKINEISSSINSIFQKYKEQKILYNSLLNDFLIQKNSRIKKFKKISEDNLSKLKDANFANESLKFETIYKFVSYDNKNLEKLFSKNIDIKLNANSKFLEVFSITRYLILKKCKKINLNIFDLLSRISKVDLVTKKTILLLISLFSNKKIFVFYNLFSELNKEELFTFKKIYNDVTKNSQKGWIIFEDSLDKVLDISTKTSIIDKSKQIEYGATSVLFNNPIYNTTNEAFGFDKNNYKTTPNIFNNIIDFNEGYDDYKIEDNHYAYGNIDFLYQWTKIVPSNTKNTISNEIIENFKNQIQFKKIVKSKNISKEKLTNYSSFENREFLIIDVKK